MKKIICLFLCAMLVFSAMPLNQFFVFAEDEFSGEDNGELSEEETVLDSEFIFESENYVNDTDTVTSIGNIDYDVEFWMDFNDCNTDQKIKQKFNSTSKRWIFPQWVDKEHGISLAMKSTSDVSVIKTLSSPITQGVYSLSFEIRQSDTKSNIAQVRLGRKSTIYRSFLTSNAGMMGFSRFTSGSTMDYKITYAANTWYKVNMWLDFYDKTIYYYIDNEYLGKTHMDKNMDGVEYLRFFLSSTDANQFTYWDNIEFRVADEKFIKETKEKGIKIPEKVESPIRCSISSKKIGNIFENGEEISLNLDFVGRKDRGEPYDVLYEAYSSNGELAWSAKDTVKAGLLERVSKVLKPKVTRFDIYTLKIRIMGENGEDYVFDKEFSIANTPSRRMSDKKFGFSLGHQMRLTRATPQTILPLFDMSGAGLMREGIYWEEYERKKGVYGFTASREKRMEEVLDYAVKYDLFITFNVSGQHRTLYPNPAGDTSIIPTTKEGLTALENFACNLARTYPQIDAFLFVNEPDAQTQFKLKCAQYATALKYFYNGIKRGNSKALVWGCNTMRADTMWVEGVIQAGGGEYMDGVSIHPYQGQGSPETTKWIEYISTTRKMLDSYGYENLTLIASEANGSSAFEYFTELQHGFNLVRQLSLLEAYDVLDGYIGYTFQTFDDANDNESNFGIIRGWNVDNSNGAKPAYLQVCNFFAQKENTVFNKLLRDDNIYVYHFKNENGKDMLMMYADRECELISLKINAEKGSLADAYGNEKEIYAIDNTYTFVLDDCPQYFSADFTNVEFTEGKITLDNLKSELTVGSRIQANITVENAAAFTYSIKGKDNLKTKVSRTQNGAIAQIEVLNFPQNFDFMARRHDYGTLDNRDNVVLEVKKGNKLYASIPLVVKYIDKPVDVTISVKAYDFNSPEHQKGVITVKNNNSDLALSGTITITEPQELADCTKPIATGIIEPYSKKEFTVRIPDSLTQTSMRIAGTITLDSGEEIPFYATGHPRSYYKTPGNAVNSTILRMTKAPKIDGKVSEGEWSGRELTSFDKSEVTFGADVHIVEAGVQTQQTFGEEADYGSGNDFSGTMYAQWDNKFLYLAAKVRDDVHINNENAIKFRTVDSAYFTLMPNLAARHDSTTLMGLTDFYGEPRSMMFNTWTNVPDKPYSYTFHVDGEDESEFEIIRDGEYTTYEAKIPWEYLLPDSVGLNDNFYFSFSVRDFDGDRDKSYSFARWITLSTKEFGNE